MLHDESFFLADILFATDSGSDVGCFMSFIIFRTTTAGTPLRAHPARIKQLTIIDIVGTGVIGGGDHGERGDGFGVQR